MDAVNLADLYQLPPLEWATITDRLEEPIPQAPGSGGPNRHTFWLSTINTDGSPHVTGLGMLYVDGSFWFETGERTRKARNLARDPRCTLSISTVEFDLVVEGEARRARHWACHRARHRAGLQRLTSAACRAYVAAACHTPPQLRAGIRSKEHAWRCLRMVPLPTTAR